MKVWYAVYTRPRFEKKAKFYLDQKGISNYLPLQRVKKKWSDRTKWVEEPLFKSYLFVQIDEKEYYDTLSTHGIVRFVSFNGKAAPMRDQDIALLHKVLDTDYELEVVPTDLTPGTQVTIEKGPLTGFNGILLAFAGEKKVRVDVLHFEHSLLITVPLGYLSLTEN